MLHRPLGCMLAVGSALDFVAANNLSACKCSWIQKVNVVRHSKSASHRVAISRYLAKLGLLLSRRHRRQSCSRLC